MATTDIGMTPEEEQRHLEAEARVQSYKYARPKLPDGSNKGLVRLCGTDIMKGVLQIIEDGGENTLHFHEGMDSFWMVVKGSCAFYGPDDVKIGDYGPMEGLVTPRGARYWFEKTSDEPLELLQVACYDRDTSSTRRIALSPEAKKTNRNAWFDGQNGNAVIDKSKA